MHPRCLELGLQLVDALNCGRSVVRIPFAHYLNDMNVSLQVLHRIKPGRHNVQVLSVEAFDKHDNSVWDSAFWLVFRLLSYVVSSVSDEYSSHWLDKLICRHSKLVVDWHLPGYLSECRGACIQPVTYVACWSMCQSRYG